MAETPPNAASSDELHDSPPTKPPINPSTPKPTPPSEDEPQADEPQARDDGGVARPSVVERFEAATHDLLMPSEADEGFRVLWWGGEMDDVIGARTAERARYLARLAGLPEPQEWEITSPSDLLAMHAEVEEWMEADERESARRLGALLKLIESELEEPVVFLFGDRRRDVVIVGRYPGGQLALLTVIVET